MKNVMALRVVLLVAAILLSTAAAGGLVLAQDIATPDSPDAAAGFVERLHAVAESATQGGPGVRFTFTPVENPFFNPEVLTLGSEHEPFSDPALADPLTAPVAPDTTGELPPEHDLPAFQQPDALGSDSSLAETDMVEPHIIGGSNAAAGEFPWQVALYVDGSFNCGGSLIHPRWVLTAAHCVTSAYSDGDWDAFEADTLDVVLGEHILNTTDGNEVRRDVVQVAVFPYYNSRNIDNDVALLKLKSPVPINTRIQTIQLATPAEQGALTFGGAPAVVSGWGRTATGAPLSNRLLKAAQPIVTQEDCRAAFQSVNAITAQMICGGTVVPGPGSCNGDSGGPLVIRNGAGAWRQIGVVSWGLNVCGQLPSVYARASSFHSWVQGIISPAYAPAVSNPGFEQGHNGAWVESSSLGSNNILTNQPGIAAHGGAWVARVGGAQEAAHLVWQRVLLTERPSTLLFQYYVRSNELDCNSDYAQVIVGGRIVAEKALCSYNNSSGWLGEAIPITVSGTTTWIGFFVENRGDHISTLFVDDVAVVTEPPPAPAVTSFLPVSARDGATVTVTGSGFFDVTRVSFGAVAAPFKVLSNTQLQVTVPANARSSKINVSTLGGTTPSPATFVKIHTLTLRQLGTGTGSVTRTGVGAIANGSRIDMTDGASVTLVAAPAASSAFDSWTYPCAGKGVSCTFAATRSAVVTVVFDSNSARYNYLPILDR